MKSLQDFKANLTESNLNETMVASSDYKISASGRKYHAHRMKIGDTTSGVKYATDDEMEDPKKLLKKGEIKLKVVESIKHLGGDPPFTLVLKRQSIRMFDHDTKIALYYNEQLKTYFSVPYSNKTGDVLGPIQSESTILGKIKEGTIVHRDGSESQINEQVAEDLINTHFSLNESNKAKFEDLIEMNAAGLEKAIEFSSKSK